MFAFPAPRRKSQRKKKEVGGGVSKAALPVCVGVFGRAGRALWHLSLALCLCASSLTSNAARGALLVELLSLL